MRSTNTLRWLLPAILSFFIPRLGFTQMYLQGGCVNETIELTQSGTFNGRPEYIGAGTVTTGDGSPFSGSLNLAWIEPDAAWVLYIEGNPFAYNDTDSPTPPPTSTSSYQVSNPAICGEAPTVAEEPFLPVTYLAFTGRATEGEVLLDWTTREEQDNAGFGVQRLTKGVWQAIGFVAANAENNGNSGIYRFTDEAPAYGSNTYRLAQRDFDGTVSYSPVVEVEVGGGAQVMALYPNPTEGMVYLRGDVSEGKLTVLDELGRVVFERLGQLPDQPIDLTSLTPQIYHLVYQTRSTTFTERLVITK